MGLSNWFRVVLPALSSSGRITTLRTPRLRICSGMKVESFTAPPSMRC